METRMKRFVLVLLLCCLAGTARASGVSSPLAVEVDGGTLYGELTLPESLPPCPAALILGDEGPVNMDGNSAFVPGKNNCMLYLAEALADQGIASLRYDRRGVGKSWAALAREADLDMERLADDAAAMAQVLRDDERFPQVVFIGHGQGGLTALLAARKFRVAALALLNCPGLPAADLVEARMRAAMTPELFNQGKAILERLRQGQPVPTVPQEPIFLELFRQEIQPLLISLLRLDPVKLLAATTMPVLIVQGTTDAEISVEHAQRLHLAGADSQLAIIDGMNHILKQSAMAPAAQRESLRDPTQPISPELPGILETFIDAAMQDTGGWSK